MHTALNDIMEIVKAHPFALSAGGAFVLTCVSNALPAKGQPFVFSQFLMGFIKELAQRVEKIPASKGLSTYDPQTGKQV